MAKGGITVNGKKLGGATAFINEAVVPIITKKDMKSIADDLRSTVKADTMSNYSKGKDYEGKKWAPLSKSTLRRKTNKKMMVETGTMKNSFKFNYKFHESGKAEFYWYNPVNYARYHQFGTKHLPKRPVIGISEKSFEMFYEETYNTIQKAIDRALKKFTI